MSKAMISSLNPGTGRVRALMLGMTLSLLAAISLSAWAQPAPPPADGGPHFGHHMRGGMGGMGGMGGPGMFSASPERMGRMVDHMLDGLNATDAQRAQIKQIAAAAAVDLKAQAQNGRALRQRGMQIFTAPTVDANAAEQVRLQMLQHHDQMSRRVTRAMLDVASVLTPEQRAKVGERMRDRQARMEERMNRADREPRR